MIETAYEYLYYGALIWLGLLILAMLIRSIIGPRITDRLLAINMIGTMVICAIAVLSRALGEGFLIDVALIYAMISFVSVLILARTYIPASGLRGRFADEERGEYEEARDSIGDEVLEGEAPGEEDSHDR
ncbi:MAG: sodium:proton antiporter [Lachnospiraceae bacterium]|nr:sodium:proton antiporter [Lachnospiraceae bacterium]